MSNQKFKIFDRVRVKDGGKYGSIANFIEKSQTYKVSFDDGFLVCTEDDIEYSNSIKTSKKFKLLNNTDFFVEGDVLDFITEDGRNNKLLRHPVTKTEEWIPDHKLKDISYLFLNDLYLPDINKKQSSPIQFKQGDKVKLHGKCGIIEEVDPLNSCNYLVSIDNDGRFWSFVDNIESLAKTNTSSEQISFVCDSLKSLLLYKNEKYGDSALHPINVFSKASAETGLLQRLDDKIARIKNSSELRQNDIGDVVGYCILLCVSRGWTDFEKFKD